MRPLWVSLAIALAACSSSTENTEPAGPIALAILNGDGQQDTVLNLLPQPLEVRVVRAETGTPVPNQLVSFVVVEGPQCGRPFAGSAVTDVNGKAVERWELGTVARVCHMEVRTVDEITGAPIVHDSFTVTVLPDAPERLERAVWPGSGVAGENAVVAVRVTDLFGNPVSGVGVLWSPAVGSGHVTPIDTDRTDGQGLAHASWRLPTVPGTYSVTAMEGGRQTTFTIMVTAGPFERLTKWSGDNQISYSDRPPQQPVVVRAEDRYGNPIAGATVAWTGSGNITWSPSSSVTGANGLASTQWVGKEAFLGPATISATVGTISATFNGQLCGRIADGC